jgi:hypothetical protein
MTFCSSFAAIEFDPPSTASHKNNFAKLVRANGAGSRYGVVPGWSANPEITDRPAITTEVMSCYKAPDHSRRLELFRKL